MSFNLIVEWDVPTQDITDSNGNTFNIANRDIAGYTLEHDVDTGGANETITITGINNSNYVFKNVLEGTYTFSVRSFGRGQPLRYSEPLTFTKNVIFPTGVNRLATIAQGGDISSALDFSSGGIVTVLNSAYSFKNVNSLPFNVSSATTAQKQQSFSAMSNSSTAFWFYDDSSARAGTSDPWKAVQVHTDATAESGVNSQDFDFTYLKELGASNNGLSVLSSGRTISVTDAQFVHPRNRVVLTVASGHNLKTGDTVTVTSISGMTQLNSQTVVVSEWGGGANQFLLRNSSNTEDLDASTFDEYTSGGTLTTSSAIRGNATQFGTTITGVNTAFDTDFSSGDIIKISTSSAIGTEVTTSEYAEVDYVIDSHTISIVSPLTRSYANAYLYQQSLKVDRSKDSILAEVTKSSGGEFSIEYTATLKSLDTSDGGSIVESANTEVTGAVVYDKRRARGEIARISMPNTRGISATPTARAEISGLLGYQGPDIQITEVTSGATAVFTTASAHGLITDDIVAIRGIGAGDDMNIINGQRGSVRLGSLGITTGDSAQFSHGSLGSMNAARYSGGSAPAGNTQVTGCTITQGGSIFPGRDATCTVTTSSDGSSIHIDSVTAAGSGYIVNLTCYIGVTISGTTHTFITTLQSGKIITNDTTTKFRLESDRTIFSYGGFFGGVILNYVGAGSTATALTSQTTVFANIQNPMTVEMQINATFDNVSDTIPAASIVDAGVLTTYWGYWFGGGGSISYQFIDIKETGVAVEAIIQKYALYPGAVVRQGTASNPTFHGHVMSVAEQEDGSVRVQFNDAQEYSYADKEPAIRAFSRNRPLTAYQTNASVNAVAPAGGGINQLTFTGIGHSTTTGTGSGATFDFKIDGEAQGTLNGNVHLTGDGVNAQGSGYDDYDTVTFTGADLNTHNSDYDADRGTVTFAIDTNGIASSSVDGVISFTGSVSTTVASTAELLTPYNGSMNTTLVGELPRKSTDSFDIAILAFIEKSDGFEPEVFSGFNGSSGISFDSPSTEETGLVDGATVTMQGITGINPGVEYFVDKTDSDTYAIHTSSALNAPLNVGEDAPDSPGDPEASTFIRGSNGYVLGRCASTISKITLSGELKV